MRAASSSRNHRLMPRRGSATPSAAGVNVSSPADDLRTFVNSQTFVLTSCRASQSLVEFSLVISTRRGTNPRSGILCTSTAATSDVRSDTVSPFDA